MTSDELKIKLTKFLIDNRPIVCLNSTYFIVLRNSKLQVLKGVGLRIGDIRLLNFEADEFVKGLSPDQWTTLLEKVSQLVNVIDVDIFRQQQLN